MAASLVWPDYSVRVDGRDIPEEQVTAKPCRSPTNVPNGVRKRLRPMVPHHDAADQFAAETEREDLVVQTISASQPVLRRPGLVGRPAPAPRPPHRTLAPGLS